LLASTFVGGTGNDGINIADGLRKNYADDNRGEILIDLNSNVYVVSSTLSSDFPATANAFDTTSHGQQDVCVFKMSQDLSQMIWSAMLGGSGNEAGYGMSLASDNSVYICGGTRSQDFPVTLNVYQDTLHGGTDGFLAHISADGRTLMQSTFLRSPLTTSRTTPLTGEANFTSGNCLFTNSASPALTWSPSRTVTLGTTPSKSSGTKA
jgi:hypothetical protein